MIPSPPSVTGPEDRLRYLAYGSNLHPIRLERRIPSARLVGLATLPGWALRFHKHGLDGSAKADMVETGCAEDRLHGAVFTLARSEAPRLDAIEGPGYRRRRLTVAVQPVSGASPPGACPREASRAERRLAVYAYVARRDHRGPGPLPFTWYRSLVAAGARLHGFPAAYRRAIEAVEAVVDPDADRRRRHDELLARLDG